MAQILATNPMELIFKIQAHENLDLSNYSFSSFQELEKELNEIDAKTLYVAFLDNEIKVWLPSYMYEYCCTEIFRWKEGTIESENIKKEDIIPPMAICRIRKVYNKGNKYYKERENEKSIYCADLIDWEELYDISCDEDKLDDKYDGNPFEIVSSITINFETDILNSTLYENLLSLIRDEFSGVVFNYHYKSNYKLHKQYKLENK